LLFLTCTAAACMYAHPSAQLQSHLVSMCREKKTDHLALFRTKKTSKLHPEHHNNNNNDILFTE
jgi:hypothetical protein